MGFGVGIEVTDGFSVHHHLPQMQLRIDDGSIESARPVSMKIAQPRELKFFRLQLLDVRQLEVAAGHIEAIGPALQVISAITDDLRPTLCLQDGEVREL